MESHLWTSLSPSLHEEVGGVATPIVIHKNTSGWSQISTPTACICHYIMHIVHAIDTELVVSLEYNPSMRVWTVQRSDEDEAQLAAQLQAAFI